MRIAVNAAILDERPTGLGVYTSNIIQELAKAGAEMRVFTSAPATVGVVPLRRIAKRVRPSRGAYGHFNRIAWSQLVFPYRAKHEKADVALVTTPTEGTVFPFVPQVVIIHDLLPLKFPAEYPRLRIFFEKVLPRILRKSAGVIACSMSTKKDCVESYGLDPDRVYVVHEGFSSAYFPGGRELAVKRVRERHGMEEYFLYVGSILPHKNVAGLLDAFALASKKVSSSLVIAGRKNRPFFPELAKRADGLGVRDRVRFLDYVPAGELPDLYRAASAFVFPSLYEGFGLQILEAMASGTPVISSRLSSLPEVAGDAACLVDPRDSGELGGAMARVISDHAWRKELIGKGRERAKGFSWEKAAKETLAVLEKAALKS